MRIAKYIAHCGLCSRRDAEKLIFAGKIKVNGQVVSNPATKITDGDQLEYLGQVLKPEVQQRIWLFYKPKGVITTHKDPQGRTTVFELLPEELGRVISVGRLDLNTEGLLLLTNSGELARKFELPATGLIREYRVRVFGLITEQVINALANGVEVDGIQYDGIKVTIEGGKEGASNTWIRMELKEGKNREIRRVLEYFDIQVTRLIRIKYGPYLLKGLKIGEVKEVKLL